MEQLATVGDVDVWPEQLPPEPEVLRRRVAGCDGLLTLLTDRIDDELLAAAGDQLRVVSNYAIGFDNVDVAAATARGVLVCNTPDVLTETTADLTFALMLAGARRLMEAAQYVHDGAWRTWEPLLLLGHDVHGACLGIVGMGRIGQAVARRAVGFGMSILYSNPRPVPEIEEATGAQYCEHLGPLLATADFVSLHAPLNERTRGLINAETLAAMKSSALLVNTARGPLVDTEALVTALRRGEIAGAALDVTEPEPLPATHPLLSLSNCLVLPHVGSASLKTREKMALRAVDNLRTALSGQRPAHLVNPAAWEIQRKS
jgi:lactate dehydrogenase-like 2-hydroxyacid dehydrogenase